MQRFLQEAVAYVNENEVLIIDGEIIANFTDNGTFVPPPLLPDEVQIYPTTLLIYEFVAFMSFSYLFILGVAYRWPKIKSEPDLDQEDPKFHISYYIKRFFSYIIFVSYMISLILSQFLDPVYYWAADFRDLSLLYGIAAAAWFLSAKSLEWEHKKDLQQEWYTHRMFWVGSFMIHFFKLFLNRELRLILFPINLIRVLAGLILGIYALYKPYDSDRNSLHDFSDMPPFAKDLLNWIENLEWLRNKIGGSRLQENPLHKESIDRMIDLIRGQKMSVDNGPNSQEKFLKERLPKLDAKIFKVSKVVSEVDRDARLYYCIQVTVQSKDEEPDNVQVDRLPRQFLQLEHAILSYYKRVLDEDQHNKIPSFRKINIDDYASEQQFIQERFVILNDYLATFVRNPRFINKDVCDFLQIPENHRMNFLNYSQYRESTEARTKKKKPANFELTTIGQSSTTPNGNYNPPNLNDTPKPQLNERPTPPPTRQRETSEAVFQIVAVCEDFQKSTGGDRYEFIFALTEKYSKQTWKIKKSYSEFSQFTERLEKKLNKRIQQFERYAPKPENNQQTVQQIFLNKRKDGLENYLNFLLTNSSYHDPLLFNFIQFDINNRRPTSANNTPRSSFISNMENSSLTMNGREEPKNPLNQDPSAKVWSKNYYTGAFKIEINLKSSAVKVLTFKNAKMGTKIKTLYEIMLEEKDSVDKYKTIRRIIQYRKFREFEQLHQNLLRHYDTKASMVPKPPNKIKGDYLREKVRPEDRKLGLQRFLTDMLKLPDLDHCDAFRDFFYLNDIRSEVKTPLDTETFDFRDEYKYDEIVDGEDQNVVKSFLKKVDIFGGISEAI
jgi:hypothetical protein